MRIKPLDGQLTLDLFEHPKHEPPNYAMPCPIREDCGAYHCESGGCGGERGWCLQAQLTNGVDIGESRWALMSKSEQKARMSALNKRTSPNWEDVQKGRAQVVDVIEPCDHCMMFWHGGRCTHTAENYAFPKQRPNGMCLKHRIIWKDN